MTTSLNGLGPKRSPDGTILSEGYLAKIGPEERLRGKKYIDILTKDPVHRDVYTKIGKRWELAPGGTSFSRYSNYVVFYLGVKKEGGRKFINKVKSMITFVGGDFSGAVSSMFENDGTFFTYITTSRDLNSVCERKVN